MHDSIVLDAADGLAWSINLCVLVTTVSPAKNGQVDQDVIRGVDSDQSKELCILWGPGLPMGMGTFGLLGDLLGLDK